MTNQNVLKFPHMITFIPIDNPEKVETTVITDPTTYDHWLTARPDCVVELWQPQQQESGMQYLCIKIKSRYFRDEINRSFAWDEIVATAKEQVSEVDGLQVGSCILGLSYDMSPEIEDGDIEGFGALCGDLYWDTLQELCEEHGGDLESGDDPIDQFFTIVIEDTHVKQ